jgi:hypothetical protein
MAGLLFLMTPDNKPKSAQMSVWACTIESNWGCYGGGDGGGGGHCCHDGGPASSVT